MTRARAAQRRADANARTANDPTRGFSRCGSRLAGQHEERAAGGNAASRRSSMAIAASQACQSLPATRLGRFVPDEQRILHHRR